MLGDGNEKVHGTKTATVRVELVILTCVEREEYNLNVRG